MRNFCAVRLGLGLCRYIFSALPRPCILPTSTPFEKTCILPEGLSLLLSPLQDNKAVYASYPLGASHTCRCVGPAQRTLYQSAKPAQRTFSSFAELPKQTPQYCSPLLIFYRHLPRQLSFSQSERFVSDWGYSCRSHWTEIANKEELFLTH